MIVILWELESDVRDVLWAEVRREIFVIRGYKTFRPHLET